MGGTMFQATYWSEDYSGKRSKRFSRKGTWQEIRKAFSSLGVPLPFPEPDVGAGKILRIPNPGLGHTEVYRR